MSDGQIFLAGVLGLVLLIFLYEKGVLGKLLRPLWILMVICLALGAITSMIASITFIVHFQILAATGCFLGFIACGGLMLWAVHAK